MTAGYPADASMDPATILLVGWILFGGIVGILGAYLHVRYMRGQRATPTNSPQHGTIPGTSNSTEGRIPSTESYRQYDPPPWPVPSPAPVSVPPAKGADAETLAWVDRLLRWIYADPAVAAHIAEEWVQVLNDMLRMSSTEQGIEIQVLHLQPQSQVPTLSNIEVDVSGKDDVLVLCSVETPLAAFVVNAVRRSAGQVWSAMYHVAATDFSGQMKVFCLPWEAAGFVKLDPNPKLKLLMQPYSPTQASETPDAEKVLVQVVRDVVSEVLQTWRLNLSLGRMMGCPKFARKSLVPPPVKPVHYDSMLQSGQQANPVATKLNKRLLVKVIEASNIGAGREAQEPYCVIEMDEPPQKFETSVAIRTNNPAWDDHFLFDLNKISEELLFEIYDRSTEPQKETFLGLGIVSVAELMKNYVQRQVLNLLSRPYENDTVSGTLTVEFLFVDGSDVPLLNESLLNLTAVAPNLTQSHQTVTPGGALITTTTTTITKPTNGVDVLANGGSSDSVLDLALRELELRQKLGVLPNPSKSTLVIHSVQRSESPLDEVPNNLLPSDAAPDDIANDRGRTRNKKEKSIFGTLRKRFSFKSVRSRSEDRSRSTEPPGGSRSSSRDEAISPTSTLPRHPLRSASVDRAGNACVDGIPQAQQPHQGWNESPTAQPLMLQRSLSSRYRGAAHSLSYSRYSVDTPSHTISRFSPSPSPSPFGSSYLDVPGKTQDTGSTHSTLSHASGLSGTSFQTYMSEASTLVIEVLENGVTKHYLVPVQKLKKLRLKRKGVKLHIYNDHIFVARHLTGNPACQVCNKSIGRRIGKQGYECRDCLLKCHKLCHFKVESVCPNSSVSQLELEYFPDDAADIKNATTSLQTDGLYPRSASPGK